MHSVIDPAILYFGTPVVLVSSTNEDGSANLAPISSAWWLGRSCESAYRPVPAVASTGTLVATEAAS